ncbi:flotillin-like FloA family protein [Flexithrix dorotheae]|uniref:flotillin-like FloA family protein n=1 Tax=Flexithrix dorotheae TaxID=70993 RepID=UPI00035F6F6A|nr:flotillin-like FloA family protein [Flexithrix dorotheae]
MIPLILIFILILIIVFGLPLFIIKLKASRNGAKITFKDAFAFYSRRTARKTIFKAIAISQSEGLNIPIIKLETHFLAGGNPELILKALTKYRNHKVINFQMLAAQDLANKNLEEIIEKGINEHKIVIDDFPIRHFQIHLTAVFFFRLGVGYKITQIEQVENEIKQILKQFGLNWDSEELNKTQKFIESNVLNEEYWENTLCLNLVEQKINLKKA